MQDKLYYGAAYYPELWDASAIDKEIPLMKQAGINVVRIAEFAWSVMEPHQDEFHVDFFVDVIKKLHANGISTVICTPTATPPIWMSHEHPERMLTDKTGTKMVHGGRQQVCTNNAFMRERSAIIVEKMAQTYGKLPGVIAWQLDNELKGNAGECYCETCKHLWHQWLEKRYGTIENLNREWGADVWSQRYERFDQVPQPFKTPACHNPSLLAMHELFSRDEATEFLHMQTEIIRKYSDIPITHNSNPYHGLDNEAVFSKLDFVSFDFYCTADEYHKITMAMDLFKSFKKDTPFWMMETSPCFSGNSWGYPTAHPHGFLKAETAVCYAIGAQGLGYWLWRQQRSGFEQGHGAVLSTWGQPGVGFEDVREAAAFKDQLQPLLAKTKPVPSPIGITYSDVARAFVRADQLENMEFDYVEQITNWYKLLLDAGLPRDLLPEHDDLSGCKILMTPYMPSISAEYRARAERFVEEGGIWMIGPMAGYRTENMMGHADHALGALEEFAGVETQYFYPVSRSGMIGCAEGEEATLTLWSCLFDCRGAKPVGVTRGGLTPGLPFITECRRGKGKVVMIGSRPVGESGSRMLQKLFLRYLKETGETVVLPSAGTMAVQREGAGVRQWVCVNMDGKGGSVTLPRACRDTLNQEDLQAGAVFVPPYGVRVLEYSI